MNAPPAAISNIASVVMNGGRFSLTTGSALTQPAAQPTATATSSVADDERKAAQMQRNWQKARPLRRVRATSDPTERSMPAVMMTNV